MYERELPLADDIFATTGPHHRTVNRIRGHVESIADPVRIRLAGHTNPHLAFQNDVCRFFPVRVIGVSRVRSVFPHVGMRKTLALQLSDVFLLIHRQECSAPGSSRKRVQRRQRPPCRNGGCCRKGAPSSGEKIVVVKIYCGGAVASAVDGPAGPCPRPCTVAAFTV
jgi:hypothetical protein